MSTYEQFCPVAKAMELLDERWTMLVMRELLAGSRQWSQLRRGVPRMSPSLLAKRLRTLIQAGVVAKQETDGQVAYVPTEAGQELRPVIDALGAWGVRWVPDLGDEDYDPHLLLWDMHRNVDLSAVPEGKTVVRFRFTDVDTAVRDWWLVIRPDEVDICDDDPGFDVDITVEGQLRSLVRVWRGDSSWAEVLRAGRLGVSGPTALRRAFPSWLKLSAFASVPRPAASPA